MDITTAIALMVNGLDDMVMVNMDNMANKVMAIISNPIRGFNERGRLQRQSPSLIVLSLNLVMLTSLMLP